MALFKDEHVEEETRDPEIGFVEGDGQVRGDPPMSIKLNAALIIGIMALLAIVLANALGMFKPPPGL